MLLRCLAILDGEKYLTKNLLAISYQNSNEPGGNEFSHCLALSCNENGKSLSLTVSSETVMTKSIIDLQKVSQVGARIIRR